MDLDEEDDSRDGDDVVEESPEMDEIDDAAVLLPKEKNKEDEATGSRCQVSSTKGSKGTYNYRTHYKKNLEKENKPTAFENDLLKVMKGREKDSDDFFASSVAESLKKVHGQAKALAKVKIQQILLEAEFPSTMPVVSSIMPEYQGSNSICQIPCNQSFGNVGGENLPSTHIAPPSSSLYEMGGF